MARLLLRLGFRPYPPTPPSVPRDSGRCFDLAASPCGPATLGMYQAASAVLLVIATARPVPPEVADVRADD